MYTVRDYSYTSFFFILCKNNLSSKDITTYTEHLDSFKMINIKSLVNMKVNCLKD